MGSIRRLESKGTLFLDFRYAGQRLREYTALPDTPTNRKRLQKALDRIEAEIALGSFDYQKTFGKPLPVKKSAAAAADEAKNLSVNYVDLGRHLAERDDCGCKMVERHEASFEFFVPNEQLTESVEPTVTDLDNPPSRPPAWITPLGICLCAPAHDMGDVAVVFNGAKVGDTTVARISAQVFASSMRRILALDDDGSENVVQPLAVMHIRPGDDERQGDATTVHQKVALAAFFSPDPSGLGRRLLAPMVPSSSRRRCSASATRSLPSRRTLPDQTSTDPRRSQRLPIRETACELRSRFQSAPWAAPSTGSRCAARRQWPRTPVEVALVGAPHRACARRSYLPPGAPVSAALLVARTHRSPPRNQRALPRSRSNAASTTARIESLTIYG